MSPRIITISARAGTRRAEQFPRLEGSGVRPEEKRKLIEAGHLRAWRRQGRGSFHLENVHALRAILKTLLRVTGFLARGERNALEATVRTLSFEFEDLPPAFDGFRILHLSDLHIDGVPGLADAVCRRLRGISADLCVLTGDYRFEVEGDCGDVYKGMKRVLDCVRTAHGTVGVLGNHDGGEKVGYLQRLGVQMLMNRGTEVRRDSASLWIAGVDDPHYFGCDDLDGALAGAPPRSFKILAAHSPELYREASSKGIHLYLCGHTHAGQICLPGGIPILVNANCPRRLTHGTWRYLGMQGYTSAGVGASLLAVRFNCPPEIVLMELRKRASAP